MDFVHQESKAEISQKVKGENILNNWSISIPEQIEKLGLLKLGMCYHKISLAEIKLSL